MRPFGAPLERDAQTSRYLWKKRIGIAMSCNSHREFGVSASLLAFNIHETQRITAELGTLYTEGICRRL